MGFICARLNPARFRCLFPPNCGCRYMHVVRVVLYLALFSSSCALATGSKWWCLGISALMFLCPYVFFSGEANVWVGGLMSGKVGGSKNPPPVFFNQPLKRFSLKRCHEWGGGGFHVPYTGGIASVDCYSVVDGGFVCSGSAVCCCVRLSYFKYFVSRITW